MGITPRRFLGFTSRSSKGSNANVKKLVGLHANVCLFHIALQLRLKLLLIDAQTYGFRSTDFDIVYLFGIPYQAKNLDVS